MFWLEEVPPEKPKSKVPTPDLVGQHYGSFCVQNFFWFPVNPKHLPKSYKKPWMERLDDDERSEVYIKAHMPHRGKNLSGSVKRAIAALKAVG